VTIDQLIQFSKRNKNVSEKMVDTQFHPMSKQTNLYNTIIYPLSSYKETYSCNIGKSPSKLLNPSMIITKLTHVYRHTIIY